MESEEAPPAVPAWARALQVVLGLLLAAYLVWTLPGVRRGPGFEVPLDGVLQGAAYVAVAAVAVAGARLRGAASATTWLVTTAVVLRALGFVVALTILSVRPPLPVPSGADAAWVLSVLALVLAVTLRLRSLAPRLPHLVVLDGTAGALLVLGLAIGALEDPIVALSTAARPRAEVVLNVGYPVLDAVLLVATAALLTVAVPRIGRADLRLAAGNAALAVVDVAYWVLLAEGKWHPGSLLGSFSLGATALMASAVWVSPDPAGPERRRRLGEIPSPSPAPGLLLPAVLAAASLLALAAAGIVGTTPLPLVCLGAAGTVAVLRGLLTLRSDRLEAGRVLGATAEDLRRFQALVEASTDFIGVADAEGRILYVNPGGRRMAGLAPDADVTSLTVADLTSEDARDAFAPRWRSILSEGSWEGESRMVPVDGGPAIPVTASSFVISDPRTHEPFAVATIQRDIRERREAEAALRHLAAQREHLLSRLVQAEEDERSRIAAEVHDDQVQVLAAADLRLGLLRGRLARDAPHLLGSLDDVVETVALATGRLRHLLFDLDSPAHTAGLCESLEDAAEFIFEGSGVQWQVTGARDLDLPESQRVTAYRVAKEALVNARKHAAADRLVVDLASSHDCVTIAVRDNGRGIGPDDDRERPGHLGLASMRDRAAVAGGHLEVRALDRGTEVRLFLPTRAVGPRDGRAAEA